MECCNSNQNGRFCCQCGKPLTRTGIFAELLRHCMANAKQKRKLSDCYSQNENASQRRMDMLNRQAEKWERFTTALQEVVDKV